ncbi:MAG TPA: class I SAM-dependent methyltransferase [Chitinophagales bacterium]|nr:class I SAM-dependent methyltransferase [Chitinophagales bacterium]HNF52514.1 class I SAM-dependent methyltransferase [Chitinophagales bacterium]HNG72697.1 class I SAM-dependent methyltransferase [Chitinophagales bacterium]
MFSTIKNKIQQIQTINKLPVGADFNPPITHSYFIIRRGILKGIFENSHYMHGKLLDFGCGSKPYKNLFGKVEEYIGLDFYNEGHSHEKEQIDVFYDGKTIPFDADTFDCILSTEVFEHIFNLDELLHELHRVLKPNGHILLTCPFVYPEHEVPFDFARYTQFALKNMLQKSGFEVIKYDKKGNIIETICQQLIIYSSTFLRYFGPLGRQTWFINLYNKSVALFYNGFCKTIGKLLPGTYHLYSSNIVVAKKIT